MTSEDSYEEIVEWLQNRPPGSFLSWVSDHVSPTSPWGSGWVDIRIPEMDNELGLNWSLTIEHLPNGLFSDRTSISPMPDLDLHSVWDTSKYEYVLSFAIKTGEMPDVEFMRQVAETREAHPGSTYQVEPAWSVERINDALMQFIIRNTKRHDIFTTWDHTLGESPMLARARETKELIDAGLMETYEIGEGLVISSEAFNQLLEMDPDKAAEITATMADIARNARGARDD